MIEINRDKSQSDHNLTALETMKRNLEDKDNNNNNNNIWIDNGFNTSNKKQKTNSHSGQQSNVSLISTQDMTNVEMDDDEDLLNDGLDQFYSQMVDSMTAQTPIQTDLSSASGDSNQSLQTMRFSRSDQNMSSG